MLIFKLQTLYILDWKSLIQSKLFSFPSYSWLTNMAGRKGKSFVFFHLLHLLLLYVPHLFFTLRSFNVASWVGRKGCHELWPCSPAKMFRCWCFLSMSLFVHFCSGGSPKSRLKTVTSWVGMGANAPANISNFPCVPSSCGLLHTTLFYWLVCSLLLGLLLSFFKIILP